MKNIIFVFLFLELFNLGFINEINAQKKNNVLIVEYAGLTNFFTLNYERKLIHKSHFMMNLRVGAGPEMDFQQWNMIYPVQLSFCTGKEKCMFEFGLGSTFEKFKADRFTDSTYYSYYPYFIRYTEIFANVFEYCLMPYFALRLYSKKDRFVLKTTLSMRFADYESYSGYSSKHNGIYSKQSWKFEFIPWGGLSFGYCF